MPKRTPSILAKARRRPARGGAPGQRPRVVSSAFSYSPLDAYRQKRPPTPAELVASYRLLAYACANIIARACAGVQIRLYATTGVRQKRAAWGNPAPVSKRTRRYLDGHPDHSKRIRGSDAVQEITDHPILDAFKYVNPWMDQFTLFELNQLNLEVVGASFWTFVEDAYGVPAEIWPLPSWRVYPQPDYFGTGVIRHYVFMASAGQVIYRPEEVLYQRNVNLFDPYTQPWSPMRAGYELTQVYDKRTEADDAWLTNLPKAGAVFVPNEDNILPFDEVFRLQMQFEEMTSRARQGSIPIMPFKGQVQPLNWPGRDPAQVAAEEMTRKDYGTIFGVPMPLIDGTAGSRANLDAAHLQLARHSVKPRLRKTEEHLNSNFIPRFPDADTDRLFLAFDDCAADEVLERETLAVYFDKGWIDRNEARAEIGYEPVDDGNVILVAGTLKTLESVVAGETDAPGAVPPGSPAPAPDPGEVAESDEAPADHVDWGEDGEFEEGDDIEVAKGVTEGEILLRAKRLLEVLEAEAADPFTGLELDTGDTILPAAVNGHAAGTNGVGH